MERPLSLAVAAAGSLAGILIATGRLADGLTPLVFALCAVAAFRLGRHDDERGAR